MAQRFKCRVLKANSLTCDLSILLDHHTILIVIETFKTRLLAKVKVLYNVVDN